MPLIFSEGSSRSRSCSTATRRLRLCIQSVGRAEAFARRLHFSMRTAQDSAHCVELTRNQLAEAQRKVTELTFALGSQFINQEQTCWRSRARTTSMRAAGERLEFSTVLKLVFNSIQFNGGLVIITHGWSCGQSAALAHERLHIRRRAMWHGNPPRRFRLRLDLKTRRNRRLLCVLAAFSKVVHAVRAFARRVQRAR